MLRHPFFLKKWPKSTTKSFEIRYKVDVFTLGYIFNAVREYIPVTASCPINYQQCPQSAGFGSKRTAR